MPLLSSSEANFESNAFWISVAPTMSGQLFVPFPSNLLNQVKEGTFVVGAENLHKIEIVPKTFLCFFTFLK